ncbi:MAG: acyl-CoA thioesterase [Alphaproteobacteria bacterium 16-39-46]|nr:MAG: acyl-CoA thioesterase [Alphaproteobacteria bacterium 16-39-46]OZA43170.1 MAG: acyl-CoA thioesterase [Alphaproteobacteria bacterium 17-39-52]HQS84004.1 acyl-CoA thioesterase [Alphaproteobacteria bacterium]HQS93884.1 acyl-CoA thioesterase [Alphaproteobacteria bacterium]
MSESTPKLQDLAIRTIAMPKDTNPFGDIFGGWLVSQMDLAGALIAQKYSKKRVATVAINQMSFKKPVEVGDEVSCYARIDHFGHTSLTIHIEVWATSPLLEDTHKVTEGIFVFVALDDQGHPSPIDRTPTKK